MGHKHFQTKDIPLNHNPFLKIYLYMANFMLGSLGQPDETEVKIGSELIKNTGTKLWFH